MNIIVCIKQVPGTNHVNVDPVTGTLIRDGVAAKMNPYDLNALELALKLIEENGGKYILRTDLGFDNNNPNFYSDLTHMSGEGKREFTRKLIDCLKLRYDY